MEMGLSLGTLNYPKGRRQDFIKVTFCFGEIVYHVILSVFLVNVNN